MEQSHAAEQPPQEQQGGPVRQNVPGQQPPPQQVAPEAVQSEEAVGEQQQRPDDPTAAQPAPQEAQAATQEAVPVPAGGESVPPGAEIPGADAERHPAEDQAPVATEAQKSITGDPGLHREQDPQVSEGAPSSVDRPVGTSMPMPGAQSGMPLAEDRAAAERAAEEEKSER